MKKSTEAILEFFNKPENVVTFQTAINFLQIEFEHHMMTINESHTRSALSVDGKNINKEGTEQGTFIFKHLTDIIKEEVKTEMPEAVQILICHNLIKEIAKEANELLVKICYDETNNELEKEFIKQTTGVIK